MRLIVGGIALLAVLLVANAIWGTDQAKQLRSLYVQHQQLTFTAPAEQVMYEEDPGECAKLLKDGHYQKETFTVGGLAQPLSLSVSFWGQFMDDGSHGFSGLRHNSPFVFMHERHSPGGHRRLVFIGTNAGWTGDAWSQNRYTTDLVLPSGDRIVPICYGVYTPLDWHVGSKSTMASFNGPFIEIGVTDLWRMYAGQADPADPTHFTLGYAINGQRGTIEAWLRDDDRVRFRLVDGPATTRPVEHISH